MKIEVNGQELDLYDSTTKIKISVLDIKDPTSRKAYKTEQIKIPASERNRAIIGEFDSLTSVVNTDQTAKYTDGVVSFTGTLLIYEAEINRNIGYYNIQIVTGNGDWSTTFEGKNLSDYDFSGLNHTYNRTNIVNSWAGTPDYVYPVIDYGKFHGVAPAGTLTNENVGVHDLLPSVNLKHIIETIFNAEGYNIDDNTAQDLSDYYLMAKNPNILDTEDANNAKFEVKGYQTETYSQTIEAGAILETLDLRLNGLPTGEELDGTNIAFNSTIYDNGSNYVAIDRKYVVPTDGSYEFYCDIKALFDFPTRLDLSDAVEMTINININGVSVKSYTTGLTSVGGGKSFHYLIKDKARYLTAGDEITISADVSSIDITNTFDEDIPIYIAIDETSYFSVETFTRPALDYEWTYSDFLPELSVLDFLKGVFHLFNVMVITEPDFRNVRLYNYNNFYLSNDVGFNLNIDRSKTVRYSFPDTPHISTVGHAIDSNDNAITNKRVVYTLSNGSDEESIINSVFANSNIALSEQIGYTIPIMHNYGTILQESPYILPSQTFEFLPRIFFYGGVKATHTWTLDEVEQTQIPVFNVSEIGIDGLQDSYTEMQYQRNNGRMLSCNIDMDSNSVNNIIKNVSSENIRKIAMIDDVRMIFNTIEYTEGKTTKVEMLRYFPVSTGVTITQMTVTSDTSSGGGTSSSGSSSSATTTQSGTLITNGDGTQYTIEFDNGTFGINYCINQSTGLNETYILHSVSSTQAVISTLVACEISWRA